MNKSEALAMTNWFLLKTISPHATLRHLVIVAGIAASAVMAHRAHADPDPKIEKADQLFAEGKALLSSNLSQACEKFDQSLSYNPAAIGTLLNVALCDEKFNRVASAVAKFMEARTRAVEQGLPQHVRAADDHIAALAPTVPHLAIKLEETITGTKLIIDDTIVEATTVSDISVDPGEHSITVTAPNRLPFKSDLVVHKGEHRDVVVPPLAAAFVIRSSQRKIGQITLATGAVGIASGIGMGLYARHLYLAQFGHKEPGDGLCNDMNICEPAGQANTSRARTLGNVGTAIGVVGVAAAAIGGYLWFRSPRGERDEKQAALVPQLSSNSLSVTAVGRF